MSLPSNVIHFANFLRRAGLPIGTGQVEDGVRALECVGIDQRRDVYWALHAVFVSKHEHDELFGYAFAAFWRDPTGSNEELVRLELPDRGERVPHRAPPRRILDAWQARQSRRVARLPQEGDPTDSPGTASYRERLRRRDFEQMSAAEIDDVKRLLKRMRFPWRARPTRRWTRHVQGTRLDLRATVRRSLPTGGDLLSLQWRRRATRPPPLVVLCDISGSMERYSRMVLHFMHALTNDRDRVEVFVFGTRLTRITRSLQHRDVDIAFHELATTVPDWGGGTRIAECLDAFNHRWARRVLSERAVFLLVSDGLERREEADEMDQLAPVLRRLTGFAPRIIWLNPLLRYEDFAPEAEGVQILLRYVTEHRTIHNLESLEQLAAALAGGA